MAAFPVGTIISVNVAGTWMTTTDASLTEYDKDQDIGDWKNEKILAFTSGGEKVRIPVSHANAIKIS